MAVAPVTRISVPSWAPAHAHGIVRLAEGFAEEDYQAIRSDGPLEA
jgi:hypothetical protein